VVRAYACHVRVERLLRILISAIRKQGFFFTGHVAGAHRGRRHITSYGSRLATWPAIAPGTSHWLPLEKPALTADLILGFLADDQVTNPKCGRQ
jgi:hypothetical protein